MHKEAVDTAIVGACTHVVYAHTHTHGSGPHRAIDSEK